ncbi:MAG: type II secretion system protein [Clostridia bacterium]
MKKFNKSSKNAGFSLVELIAVIAVMVILAGVAVPIYGSYTESAAEAADSTYINEAYRAAAVVAAEDVTTLVAVGYTVTGEILVSHGYQDETATSADDKYLFCNGCSNEIVAIIGGMQDFQSSTMSNATPTEGETFETAIGTLTYYDTLNMGGGQTIGGWVLEVDTMGEIAAWS